MFLTESDMFPTWGGCQVEMREKGGEEGGMGTGGGEGMGEGGAPPPGDGFMTSECCHLLSQKAVEP